MRVVLFGLGPIGSELVACAVAQGHEIGGAIDIDPSKVGFALSDVAEAMPEDIEGVTDVSDLDGSADVVLHATRSSLAGVVPQLRMRLARGLEVVSTCEELAYPWRNHAALAEELDAAARATGATLIGARNGSRISPGRVTASPRASARR
jgi:4-hydroxy-tetrahydrodipicolinate reductase